MTPQAGHPTTCEENHHSGPNTLGSIFLNQLATIELLHSNHDTILSKANTSIATSTNQPLYQRLRISLTIDFSNAMVSHLFCTVPPFTFGDRASQKISTSTWHIEVDDKQTEGYSTETVSYTHLTLPTNREV